MIMAWLNAICGFFVDQLLAPFDRAWPALAAAALATALLMLFVVRLTAHPNATIRAKNRLIARVLELVLFRHDAGVSFSAGGRILMATWGHLRTLLIPLAVGLVPFLFIMAQLACWLETRPLAVGEAAVVEVQLRDGFPIWEQSVSLEDPGNAPVETEGVRTGGVRTGSPATVAWRVRARQEGTDWLTIQVAGESPVRKQFVVSPALHKTSSRRTGGGFWDSLWYPGEPPLDAAGSVTQVIVRYPARQWRLGSYDVDWLLAFVVLAVAFGLVLKRPLRVHL